VSGQGDRYVARKSAAQKAAANRSPRTCPRCLRKGGLGERITLGDYARAGAVRTCRYCGHQVGTRDGQPFGRRDVTPEPGARGGTHLPHLANPESGAS
jgi:hypothetical protein